MITKFPLNAYFTQLTLHPSLEHVFLNLIVPQHGHDQLSVQRHPEHRQAAGQEQQGQASELTEYNDVC